MLSHTHGDVSHIELCGACGETILCHTVTGKEKRCTGKKQPQTQTILWQPQNRHTHIKLMRHASIEVRQKGLIEKNKTRLAQPTLTKLSPIIQQKL
ncbi:MAG: hypothetical protein NWE98_10515 [Candidatus Bathyarchaeota archaeon]|nr:hypothetical protein [Candidatus Bathyarchaeota archaeon]